MEVNLLEATSRSSDHRWVDTYQVALILMARHEETAIVASDPSSRSLYIYSQKLRFRLSEHLQAIKLTQIPPKTDSERMLMWD